MINWSVNWGMKEAKPRKCVKVYRVLLYASSRIFNIRAHPCSRSRLTPKMNLEATSISMQLYLPTYPPPIHAHLLVALRFRFWTQPHPCFCSSGFCDSLVLLPLFLFIGLGLTTLLSVCFLP